MMKELVFFVTFYYLCRIIQKINTMRKKANLSEVSNFRTADDSFFRTITVYENKKQITPFIFFVDGKATAIDRTSELLNIANDNDIILKGWVGQWRTDIFSFKLSELKEYISKQ